MDYLVKAEKALKYLETSEEEYARLKALHQAEKERIKIVLASETIESCEKTQSGKETWAKAGETYMKAVLDWENAMDDFYLVEATRKRAELTIEMYRSVNAAMGRGNIT